MSGCEDARNAITIYEIPCPRCGEIIEVFDKDGHFAVDAVCESCGYALPAGEPTDQHVGN